MTPGLGGERRRRRLSFLAAVLASLLFLAACGGDPSPETCTDYWNDSGNRANHAVVSEKSFRAAIVDGWHDKSGTTGCTVIVLEKETGGSWTLYGGYLETLPQLWDMVSGSAWGKDSPEGNLNEANADVLPDGWVRLR